MNVPLLHVKRKVLGGFKIKVTVIVIVNHRLPPRSLVKIRVLSSAKLPAPVSATIQTKALAKRKERITPGMPMLVNVNVLNPITPRPIAKLKVNSINGMIVLAIVFAKLELVLLAAVSIRTIVIVNAMMMIKTIARKAGLGMMTIVNVFVKIPKATLNVPRKMVTINSTDGILLLVAANAIVVRLIPRNTVKIPLGRAINGMPKNVAASVCLALLVIDLMMAAVNVFARAAMPNVKRRVLTTIGIKTPALANAMARTMLIVK